MPNLMRGTTYRYDQLNLFQDVSLKLVQSERDQTGAIVQGKQETWGLAQLFRDFRKIDGIEVLNNRQLFLAGSGRVMLF